MKYHKLTDVNNFPALSGDDRPGDNLIINGSMNIRQRGVSFVSPPNISYTLDRWAVLTDAGTATVSQSTGNPLGITQNTILWTNTSTGSNSAAGVDSFYQFILGRSIAHLLPGTSSSKYITCSFWARSSITGTYCVFFKNDIGELGGNSRSYIEEFTIDVANTWEYKTITIRMDTTGTWNTSTGRGLTAGISLDTGPNLQTTAGSWQTGNYYGTSGQINFQSNSGATFAFTNFKVEEGQVATPMPATTYEEEFRKCSYYYYKFDMLAHTSSWTAITNPVRLPVTRTTATFSVISITQGTGFDVSHASIASGGGTVSNVYQNAGNSLSAIAVVEADAEL